LISEKAARGDGDYRILDGEGGVDAAGSFLSPDWTGYRAGMPSSAVVYAGAPIDWVGYRTYHLGVPPVVEPSLLSSMRMIRTVDPLANGHSVRLPDARKLDFLGYPVMVIVNLSSTYSFDILSNDGLSVFLNVPAGTAYKLGLFDRSTANGVWYARAKAILGRGSS
jgi:hypothetical protein